MRHRVKHPTMKRRSATCGTDHALGYFATVTDGERIVAEYDRTLQPYDGIPGLLMFLATHGFFLGTDAGLAIQWIRHSLAKDAEDEGVRLAAEVAEKLYSSGGLVPRPTLVSAAVHPARRTATVARVSATLSRTVRLENSTSGNHTCRVRGHSGNSSAKEPYANRTRCLSSDWTCARVANAALENSARA